MAALKDSSLKSASLKKANLLCDEVTLTKWVVNKPKLRALLAAERLSLVEVTSSDFSELKTIGNGVLLLSQSQVALLPKSMQPSRWRVGHNGMLLRFSDGQSIGSPFFLAPCSTTQIVRKWLKGDNECVVCFEHFPDYVECSCGYNTCFGCKIDMLSLTETEMTVDCCNCRRTEEPLGNLLLFWRFIHSMLERPESKFKSIAMTEDMTEDRLAFIKKITGVDLALGRDSVKDQTDKLDFAILGFMKSRGVDFTHDVSLEISTTGYKEVRRVIEAIREVDIAEMSSEQKCAAMQKALRKVFGAAVMRKSADISSAADSRPHFGCANCGKQFWDKRERKRAPKCPKCKRTAYCCAKCRKKHVKTHAGECTAVSKKKRKTKTKPKKGCTPY